MSKKHVGKTLSVAAMGIVMGSVFACSSSNTGGGFPSSEDGGSSGSSYTTSSSGSYTTSSSGSYTNSSSGSYTASSSGSYTTSSGSQTTSSGSQTTSSSGSTATGGTYSGPTDSSAIMAMTPGSMGCGGFYDITGVGSGYAFAYTDATTNTTSCATSTPMGMCPSSPTTIANDSTALCVSGTTSVQNPPSYSCYGGGFGINLGQMMGSMTNTPINAPSGSKGISYSLTGYATANYGMRMQLMVGSDTYCATLTSGSGTATWADFNTKCYDSPPDGTALTAAPQALSQIQFQVNSGSASFTFGVCVDAVSFAM